MAADDEFDKRAEMLRRVADRIRVPEATPPDEWAAENRVYGPTTGAPGPRNPYLSPSLVPLGKAAVSGKYKRIVGVTSAQTGKTDTELDVIGQRLDQRPTPIIYVGPGESFNRDQFEPRLKQMIDECEGLKEKLVRGRREKKLLKIVAGVTVRLASAGSSTALKSDPAGLAIVDEYDEMSENIRGQGDPLGLVEARGETYPDFVTLVTSTPKSGTVETEEHVVGEDADGRPIKMEFFAIGELEEIESPIWRLFQSGTRHHWAWDCPHCGVPFIPMRKHLHWEEGATPAQAARTAYLECPHNGCVIEDDTADHEDYQKTVRARMNATGFMIAPGQSIKDARAGRNDPDNSTYSQWSSGLASPFVSWGTRAERLVRELSAGQEDRIQTTVNSNFGELYAPGVSGDLPDWKALLEHRQGYAKLTLHRGILRVVMGVDVQKNGIYYVIRGFGSRGTSWLIDSGFLIGETAEDEVWEDLANIMLSPIQGVHVEKCFIDSGFRPDKPGGGSVHRVYDFCRQYSFVAVPCKGRSTTGGRPYSVSKQEVKPDGKRRPFSINLAMLDPDFFKSLVHTRIKTRLGANGAFYLHSEADEDYARQVLSEVRVVTAGKSKAEWKKVRKHNHLLDCEALAAAAGYVLNVHTIPEGIERDWGEDDAAMPETVAPEVEEEQPPKPEPTPKPVKVEGTKEGVLDSLRKRFGRASPGGGARFR